MKSFSKIVLVFISLCCSSCTLTVNFINTQGKADDVVDTDQKASPNIAPNIQIPTGIF